MPEDTQITPELLVDQFRLSEPRISPDGERIAYVITPIARSGKHPTSEIWIVGFDGTGERRFTTGSGQDTSPRWSPDGTFVAFVSDRHEPEKGQLYVMSTTGGEAVQFSHRKSAVSNPCWSPDGRLVGFLSEDEPSEVEEKDKKEKRDHVVEGERLKRVRLYVMPADGGEPQRISPEGESNVWDYAWSPDGNRVAAVTTPSPRLSDRRETNTVLLLDPSIAENSVLFTFPSLVSHPRWSPDSTRVAFTATAGRVVLDDQLYVADTATGEYRLVTGGYAGRIDDIAWTAGASVLAVALEDLHGAINEIDVDTGVTGPQFTPPESRRGDFGESLSVDGAGRRLVAVRSSSFEPPEIVAGHVGQPLRAVSHSNKSLAEARFQKAQTLSWRSMDDLEISGLLVTPPHGSPPFPTVLNIHGGPASAFSDRFAANWHDWSQLLAANGFAVLMPNPRGSSGRGSAFTDANFRDLGGKEFQDDLAGLDLLIERGVADTNRLGIAGWSHGGYIAAWAVTQTDRFKAAAMGAGVANMVSDQGTNDIPGFNLDYFYDDYASLYADPSLLWDRSPLKYVSRVTTPTLVLHGENDDRVAASQGHEFYRALKSLGVPTTLVTYPREPHGIREREHQIDVQRRVLDWFIRHILTAEQRPDNPPLL